MVGAVNGLMDKVSKDVITVLPKKTKELQNVVPGQLDKIKDKIPSPETIKARICESGSMDTSKKMYNQMGDMMDKAQNLLDKVKRMIGKLTALISKVKDILESILAIAVTLKTIIDVLKTVITGFKAVVNGLQFIPSTAATPIPVGSILIAKDGIKKSDDKLKLFTSVLGGIVKKVTWILSKLVLVETAATTLDSLLSIPQGLLDQSSDVMDQCMRDELVNTSPPADSLEDGVDGGVDAQNQTLDSLIDKENQNQRDTTKIEEWGYKGAPKTKEYNVKTIPSEEL